MSTLSLGWRNIWRNKRRTFISMSAVGVGLVLVLLYSGLFAGMLGDAKNQLDNVGMGHVEVYAKGFRPKQNVTDTMPAPTWIQQAALPQGAEVGVRVLTRGLASSAHGSEPVQVLGVDFTKEPAVSAHLRHLPQGALPQADDERGVIVGDKLAEALKLKVGSKLRVMVQRADGEMGANLFRVRGVFHSIVASLNKRQVYVTQAAARTLTGLPDGVVHQVVIQLPEAGESDAVAARVTQATGGQDEVVTWAQLLPILKKMEDLTNSIVFAIAAFVYLLVGLGILNTMLMSVLERTREFGVLMSVGTRPSKVVSLVLSESFWIATVSVLLGVALGGWLTWYFSHHAITLFAKSGESMELGGAALSTQMYTRFDIGTVVRASLYVYVMALVVGLYPAFRVSRLTPAEALRR